MDYAELPLPPALDGLVAAVWTAEVPADGPEWIAFEAVPDGCIELIRRHAGRSIWRREQPECFATGLATRPAELRFGAGARFTGVKLWPWAWHALGGPPCRSFADDWIAIDAPEHAGLIGADASAVPDRLATAFAGTAPSPLARAILSAAGPGDLVRTTGLPMRRLQRQFAQTFGMPPRTYLRLLRLRAALIAFRTSPDTLAGTAASQGYADQAHMAREFRALAGLPPRDARRRARGPFV